MSTFGTFLLAIAAFIGTVMIIVNPTPKLVKWARGKKISEIESEAENWVEEHEAGEILTVGCRFLLFLLLSLFYSFVVEPIAVIAALVNKIGYQPLAYTMLAIVALPWIVSAGSIIKKRNNKKGAVVTEEGTRVEGVIEEDEEIKLPHPLWIAVRRAFFSLPTLYLWYVFFVIIDVLE